MSLKDKIKFNFPHVSEYTDRGNVENNLTDEERNNIKSDVKIKAMCFNGDMNLAVTNRGQVLPCCHCDTETMMNDPDFKKLAENSYLKDYDHVNDILSNDHWQAFHKSLENNRGPFACWDTCRSNKKQGKQEMTVAEGGKLKIWERK
jgi:hypothetical protein|tara:strand:- start:1565 stop:2005 length:441 start_codon:yes stop_codon:yes gene_type:complete